MDDSIRAELRSSGDVDGLAFHVLGLANGVEVRCKCSLVVFVADALLSRRQAVHDQARDAVADKGGTGADANRKAVYQEDFFGGQPAVVVVGQLGTSPGVAGGLVPFLSAVAAVVDLDVERELLAQLRTRHLPPTDRLLAFASFASPPSRVAPSDANRCRSMQLSRAWMTQIPLQ